MSNKESTGKVPTKYLPKDWKKLGADKFKLAESTIGKIVNGHRNNPEVFDFFLELALKGKLEEKERVRVQKLLNK